MSFDTQYINTSESEEMYLITIAMAVEDGHQGPVAVRYLADALSVSRVAANEMVNKLADRGFIDYLPYKGVVLTDPGEEIARSVLRRRRLWSLFLTDNLGLSPSRADEVACEFEHVTPAEVAQRLAGFLGDPSVGPQGKPIPVEDPAATSSKPELAVAEMKVGDRGRVVRIEAPPAVRSFLVDEGLMDGASLTMVAIGDDRGCLVDTGRGHVHLAAGIAGTVMVNPEGK